MKDLWRIADASLGIFLEVLPFFAVGVLLAGILKVTEDRLRLGDRLGRSPAAIFLGAALGCIVPVCSCGVVPVALGLLSAGAGPGPVFAFLASAPVINPASFVMTAGVLGYPLALGRLLGAMALGVLLGFLGRRLGVSALDAPRAVRGSPCGCSGGARIQLRDRAFNAFLHAGDTFVSLSRYLAAGVLLGGVLDACLEPSALADRFTGPLAIPVAAAAGVPLYVCSCAEVPIGLALARKGLDPAAVLTFLLAGPGVSAFSLAMLASFLKKRAVLAYAGVFLAGSMGLGFLWKGLFS
jgi:hypothetical protein